MATGIRDALAGSCPSKQQEGGDKNKNKRGPLLRALSPCEFPSPRCVALAPGAAWTYDVPAEMRNEEEPNSCYLAYYQVGTRRVRTRALRELLLRESAVVREGGREGGKERRRHLLFLCFIFV